MGHCQLALPSRRRDLLTVVGCALETVFSAPGRKTDRVRCFFCYPVGLVVRVQLPADARLITAFHSVSVPTMSIQVSLPPSAFDFSLVFFWGQSYFKRYSFEDIMAS